MLPVVQGSVRTDVAAGDERTRGSGGGLMRGYVSQPVMTVWAEDQPSFAEVVYRVESGETVVQADRRGRTSSP